MAETKKVEKTGCAKIDSIIYTPIESGVQMGLGSMAKALAPKAPICLAVTLVVGVIMSAVAYLLMTTETDFLVLWFDPNTRTMRYVNWFMDTYAPRMEATTALHGPDVSTVSMEAIVVGKPDALKEQSYPDAISLKSFDYVWQIHHMTQSFEVDTPFGKYGHKEMALEGDPCQMTGYWIHGIPETPEGDLDPMGMNPNSEQNEDNFEYPDHRYYNMMNDTMKLQIYYLPHMFSMMDPMFSCNKQAGFYGWDYDLSFGQKPVATGVLIKREMMQYAMVEETVTVDWGGMTGEQNSTRWVVPEEGEEEEAEKASLKWQEMWLEKMVDLKATMQADGLDVYYKASRSMTDQMMAVVLFDIQLFGIAMVLMMIVFVCCIGRTARKDIGLSAGQRIMLGSRGFLGVIGMVLLLLAMGSGFGLMVLIGVPWVQIDMYLPFVLLGIGIDDMLIVVDAMDRFDHLQDDAGQRGYEALANCCMTITLTTLSDIIAFSLCLLFPQNIIRYFAFYAIGGLLFIYIFTITGWLCACQIDLNAKNGGKNCCIPVIGAVDEAKMASIRAEKGADEKTSNLTLMLESAEDNEARMKMMKGYADLMQKLPCKIVVLIGFTIAFILALVTAPSVEGGLEEIDLIPEGYLKDYMLVEKDLHNWEHAPGCTIMHILKDMEYYQFRPNNPCMPVGPPAPNSMGGWSSGPLPQKMNMMTGQPIPGAPMMMHDTCPMMYPVLMGLLSHANHIYENPNIVSMETMGQMDIPQHMGSLLLFAHMVYQFNMDDAPMLNTSYGLAGANMDFMGNPFTMPPTPPTFQRAGIPNMEMFYAAIRLIIDFTPYKQAYPMGVIIDNEKKTVTGFAGFFDHYGCDIDIQTAYDCVGDVYALNDKLITETEKMVEAMGGDVKGLEHTKRDDIFVTDEQKAWDLNTQMFSFCYLWWELRIDIFAPMRAISTYTVVGVVFISIFFLPSLRGVVVLGLTVLMVFTHLMASLVYLGYKLNILTAVNIIMAIGFAVDYSAHIIHAYYTDENAVEHEEETPFAPIACGENEAVKLRMERAMFAMGPNVIMASGTTLLGVLCLAFSQSPIFRMFFWLVLVLVVTSMLHALLWVPVLLTFMPPAASPKGAVNTEKHPNRPSSVKAVIRKSASGTVLGGGDPDAAPKVDASKTAPAPETPAEETAKPAPAEEPAAPAEDKKEESPRPVAQDV